MDWNSYCALASQKYKDVRGWRMLKVMHGDVAPGDFIWTRDEEAKFYLGRVSGEWRYVGNKAHVEADLVNVWGCDWTGPHGLDMVPAAVQLCRGVYKQIKGEDADRIAEDTKVLYASVTGQSYMRDIKTLPTNLFRQLNYSDCEDLVALYLQDARGYSVVPSSAKHSQAKYEFLLIHRQDGHAADLAPGKRLS